MPTFKVIYDRDKEIENFVPKDFYKLEATFKTKDEKEYNGTYFENDIEKFESKETLERMERALANQSASINDKQVERKREYPPYLFNLSNLQGYITSKYKGWTSDKVLKVAQLINGARHLNKHKKRKFQVCFNFRENYSFSKAHTNPHTKHGFGNHLRICDNTTSRTNVSSQKEKRCGHETGHPS